MEGSQDLVDGVEQVTPDPVLLVSGLSQPNEVINEHIDGGNRGFAIGNRLGGVPCAKREGGWGRVWWLGDVCWQQSQGGAEGAGGGRCVMPYLQGRRWFQ